MFKNFNVLRNVTTTAVLGLSLISASAHADYNFNFDGAVSGTSANDLAVNPYSDVSFLSGFLTADLDAEGYEILDAFNQTVPGFTHWEAYSDSDIKVRDPAFYNRGVAPSAANALDAVFDQIFIKFDTAQNLTSFSAQLDNSQFGIYNASFIFLDALGKTLSTVNFDSYGNPGAVISSGALNGVSGVVLSGGKLYDNINISTVAPVPEPETYALLLAGLGLLGVANRRRKNTISNNA
jgi:hypothetical protein